MTLADVARLAILVFVGLFVLADALLMVGRPELMWSYQSHSNYWLRALMLACVVGMLAHFAYEWRAS